MIKRLIYVMMIGLLGCNSDDEVKSDVAFDKIVQAFEPRIKSLLVEQTRTVETRLKKTVPAESAAIKIR